MGNQSKNTEITEQAFNKRINIDFRFHYPKIPVNSFDSPLVRIREAPHLELLAKLIFHHRAVIWIETDDFLGRSLLWSMSRRGPSEEGNIIETWCRMSWRWYYKNMNQSVMRVSFQDFSILGNRVLLEMSVKYANCFEAVFLYHHPKCPKMTIKPAAKYLRKSPQLVDITKRQIVWMFFLIEPTVAEITVAEALGTAQFQLHTQVRYESVVRKSSASGRLTYTDPPAP
ncbi:hypothetical protein WN51_01240 [Melipona quadrifasciata]|uniref:Uncharacterized protein n=1 Tax=Melipona quadrifasciata TaxID=166423 RepID=A0A0M9A0P4_9HYME|nr:hypothetical protein WN51_01240 [Melipona quadrifasciata]